jgi:hypothetical protein
MQHIDKIEKFFEFLEEHLESGFEKIKRTYSLGYYDEFFDATRNDNTDEPILVDKGGYIVTDPITGNEEYFDEDIYLNPFKQIKRIDVRRQGENEIINSYEVSLYNDLHKFYQNEFRKFEKNIFRFLLINSLNGDNTHFLETFFKIIEYYRKQAENPKFSVNYKNIEDIQLLSWYLKVLSTNIKLKNQNEPPKKLGKISKPHISTIIKHKEYSEFYKNSTALDKYQDTASHFGISVKTIERALEIK